jgi:Tfp pilus assembly major pilin PilA
MELELATGLMNVAAAALTLGAVAIPLFKKTFKKGQWPYFAVIGANHG